MGPETADRLAGAGVAALALLALLDAGGPATVESAAVLLAALSVAGLVVVLRIRAR